MKQTKKQNKIVILHRELCKRQDAEMRHSTSSQSAIAFVGFAMRLKASKKGREIYS